MAVHYNKDAFSIRNGITTIVYRFSRFAEAYTCSGNKKTSLDHKIDAYKVRNIKFVIVEADYTNFVHIQTHVPAK